VLGKGAFGKVSLGIHKLTGKFVAIKSISKKMMTDEASKNKVMREVSIWKELQHPSVIQLYESFESEKHLLYVEELCAGGDLLTYVRRRRKLKERVAKFILKQILDGLHYCHSKSILHRDIKLDNILLNAEGRIKV
jgi:serine/threonine protein kinase